MRKDGLALCEGFERRTAFERDGLFLVGLGFDGTASFRRGAKEGPSALRRAFVGIETYSPYLDSDLLDQDRLFDLGDIVFPEGETEESYLKALDSFSSLIKSYHLGKDRIKMVTLGGEHSVSYGPLKKYLADFPDLCILHLDAHADIRDGYLGFHYSHASIIRRILDLLGPGQRLLQYGIRSGTKEEYALMAKYKTRVETKEELFTLLEALAHPIYMTLDLDFFDPSCVPGVGTPEAGGETFSFFVELVKILRRKNFVGADIVELAPNLDPSGISSVFAAGILRETILALIRGRAVG